MEEDLINIDGTIHSYSMVTYWIWIITEMHKTECIWRTTSFVVGSKYYRYHHYTLRKKRHKKKQNWPVKLRRIIRWASLEPCMIIFKFKCNSSIVIPSPYFNIRICNSPCFSCLLLDGNVESNPGPNLHNFKSCTRFI